MTSRRALIGLGSNLGRRWPTIAAAVARFGEIDPAVRVSSIYETDPVGGPAAQPSFLNCVVSFESELGATEILHICQGLERDAQRVRTVRWGPRTLDADVLWIDGYSSDDPELTVPHPRMFERAFVLAPLEEVAPDIVERSWRGSLGIGSGRPAGIRRVGALLAT